MSVCWVIGRCILAAPHQADAGSVVFEDGTAIVGNVMMGGCSTWWGMGALARAAVEAQPAA